MSDSNPYASPSVPVSSHLEERPVPPYGIVVRIGCVFLLAVGGPMALIMNFFVGGTFGISVPWRFAIVFAPALLGSIMSVAQHGQQFSRRASLAYAFFLAALVGFVPMLGFFIANLFDSSAPTPRPGELFVYASVAGIAVVVLVPIALRVRRNSGDFARNKTA